MDVAIFTAESLLVVSQSFLAGVWSSRKARRSGFMPSLVGIDMMMIRKIVRARN